MKTVNVDSDTQIKVAVCRPAIRNALRRAGIRKNRHMSLALVAPPDATLQDYVDALKAELGATGLKKDFRITLFATTARKKEWAWEEVAAALSDADGVIALIPFGVSIPPDIAVALDMVVSVGPIRPIHLASAIRTVFDVTATTEQSRRLLTYPRAMLLKALRRGRSIEMVLARLEGLPPEKPKIEVSTMGVEDLPGFGEAKTWAMNLAVDLKDWRNGIVKWSDVDCGLLLSGPPGVGKTMFAAAVAKTCDASFVSASSAQWQSEGHLGDYLQAMRKTFREAAEKAPTILFLDEFDAVGDRSRFSGDNASYGVQVVNGLLEALDGAKGRDGVVVIAATNHPEAIDPALRRPGRLDRHIFVPLPDYDDRKAILALHLGAEIPDEVIAAVAKATTGYSGADLAQLAKDARKTARRARRGISGEDLLSAAPPLVAVDEEVRRASSLHEAGHALVGLELQVGEIVMIAVPKVVPARGDSLGYVGWNRATVVHRHEQSYRDEIAMLLAGRAAEQEVLGRSYAGSGGAMGSDIQRATDLATMMVGSLGMGSLLYNDATSSKDLADLRRNDGFVRRRVERLLDAEMVRARQIIRTKRNHIDILTDALLRDEVLAGDRVARLLM